MLLLPLLLAGGALAQSTTTVIVDKFSSDPDERAPNVQTTTVTLERENLVARQLSESTHTVTILDDNPDQRTLNTHTTTAPGDVFTTVTLHPDGVNVDGQTRYALYKGVSAETTVTSLMSIPPSTTPTTTRPGTATHSLPWYQGHHIEVVIVTDADGTVHNVTRVDQQSTHVTVSASTKPDGTTVLVSHGSYPTSDDPGTTTTIITRIHTSPSTPIETVTSTRLHTLFPPDGETTAPANLTHVVKVKQNFRSIPVCNNDIMTMSTLEPGCWPLYDRFMPQPTPHPHSAIPDSCKDLPMHTVYNVVAAFPMGTPAPRAGRGRADGVPGKVAHVQMMYSSDHDDLYFKSDPFLGGNPKFGNGTIKKLREVSYGLDGHKYCAERQEVVDFGTCGGVHYWSSLDTQIFNFSKNQPYWKRFIHDRWWIFLLTGLFAFILMLLCCCLPFCIRKRKNRREPTEKNPNGTQVVSTTPQGTGSSAGGVAGGTGAGGTGAGGTGAGGTAPGGAQVVTTGTTAPPPAGTAPTSTATGAPTEVVTTTTETGKDGPGTMRRAAEEGRAGQRVRFDGTPNDTTSTTTTHQVDGTAEVRTGSEVFDVGSMRGRKRNRGDEPL